MTTSIPLTAELAQAIGQLVRRPTPMALTDFVHQAAWAEIERRNPAKLASRVDQLVEAMAALDLRDSARRMARIKAHKYLTGSTLGESKNWVETHYTDLGKGGIIR